MKRIFVLLIAVLCSFIIIGAVASAENISDELASQEEMEVVDAPESISGGNDTPLKSSDSDNLKASQDDKVSVSITLFWNDAENNSTRPNGIEVYLYANGKEVDSIYLTKDHAISDGMWAYSFEDLPKYDEDNKPITYTVKEQDMAFYVTDVMKNSNYEFMIINTFSMPQPQPLPDDPVDDDVPNGDAVDDGSQDGDDTDNSANATKTITKNPKKAYTTNSPVNHNNTGNPIFVLVLVLISTVFISLRRKD